MASLFSAYNGLDDDLDEEEIKSNHESKKIQEINEKNVLINEEEINIEKVEVSDEEKQSQKEENTKEYKEKEEFLPIEEGFISDEDHPIQKISPVQSKAKPVNTKLVLYGDDDDPNEYSLELEEETKEQEINDEKEEEQGTEIVINVKERIDMNLENKMKTNSEERIRESESKGSKQSNLPNSESLSDFLNPEISSPLSAIIETNNNIDNSILLTNPSKIKCSKRLQEKVTEYYMKFLKEGKNLNLSIQKKKKFRNPSIYEKLIDMCGIDEKGTNYPPELFNPSIWGSESHYTKLSKAQEIEMEKKEKHGRKATDRNQVPQVTLPKKVSKWDNPPYSSSSFSSQPSVLIPAIGTLTKPK